MSSAIKVTLTNGREWAVGYRSIPIWVGLESIAQVVIPIEQLEGMTAQEIGEFVLACVPVAEAEAREAIRLEEETYGARYFEEETDVARAGYVYVVRAVDTLSYKFGKSMRPPSRSPRFSRQNPVPVELVVTLAVDHVDGVEKALRTRFAAKRVEGDWFLLSLEDVEEIRRWAT